MRSPDAVDRRSEPLAARSSRENRAEETDNCWKPATNARERSRLALSQAAKLKASPVVLKPSSYTGLDYPPAVFYLVEAHSPCVSGQDPSAALVCLSCCSGIVSLDAVVVRATAITSALPCKLQSGIAGLRLGRQENGQTR